MWFVNNNWVKKKFPCYTYHCGLTTIFILPKKEKRNLNRLHNKKLKFEWIITNLFALNLKENLWYRYACFYAKEDWFFSFVLSDGSRQQCRRCLQFMQIFTTKKTVWFHGFFWQKMICGSERFLFFDVISLLHEITSINHILYTHSTSIFYRVSVGFITKYRVRLLFVILLLDETRYLPRELNQWSSIHEITSEYLFFPSVTNAIYV